MRVRAALLGFALLASAVPAAAHEPTPAEVAWVDGMAAAANAWLGSLGRDASRARVPFPDANRLDWHYVPRARRGIPLREMTPPQRGAATALVRASLSERGAQRVQATFALEDVLRDLEGSSPRLRDPLNYAFTAFGEPGTPPWGWRVEGHHLSVNVTVAAPGHVSTTPFFTGSHPARIPSGPRTGERLQRAEHDLALALVRTFDARQWAGALLRERSLGNVVAGPGRAEAMARPEGLLVAHLSEPQRDLLLRLVEAYVGLARDELGRPYLALVREGLDRTRFAWAGGTREGTAFYYRIHGPRIWVEFDDTQDGANHVHALWRDPLNDFGRDDLREHYREHHGRAR